MINLPLASIQTSQTRFLVDSLVFARTSGLVKGLAPPLDEE